jgi:uncharacterized membrane protein YhfC
MEILYFTFPLSGILTFVLALGVGYFLSQRLKLSWRLYWIGAAVFVLSQVFHIPFNAYVLPALARAGLLPSPPEPWALLSQGLILGLSAGIFEEGARYLMYRYWTKDARSWSKGLLLGAGHGGVEAMLVGALILLTFINLIALRGADLDAVVPADQLTLVERQLAYYWSMPWYESMLGFVERLFTLPVHVALSVIVLQVFVRRQIRWLFLAVAWHTLLNAVGAVVVPQMYGIYWGEAAIGAFGLISVLIIFALRQPEPAPPPEEAPEPLNPIILQRVEETEDQIELSRYNERS